MIQHATKVISIKKKAMFFKYSQIEETITAGQLFQRPEHSKARFSRTFQDCAFSLAGSYIHQNTKTKFLLKVKRY